MLDPLTRCEMEILRLLAEGLSNREIAKKRVIAPGTVKWYNKQIFNKLNVHSREQALPSPGWLDYYKLNRPYPVTNQLT